MVVRGVLTGDVYQTEIASVSLHLGRRLLVVSTFFVDQPLVPGLGPHVALLAVIFICFELELSIVVVLGVELGRGVLQPLRVQEPLMLRPQLFLLVLVPESIVISREEGG